MPILVIRELIKLGMPIFFYKGMKQSVKNYATACYIICREKKSTNGIRSNTVGVRYERITTYVYICGPWPFPVSDLY